MQQYVQFITEPRDAFVIIKVICGIIKPDILKTIDPPNAVTEGFSDKGVVLRGGAEGFPMWLCGFLVHFYHATRFVAIYDPRLPGAVVVEDHFGAYSAGDVITL